MNNKNVDFLCCKLLNEALSSLAEKDPDAVVIQNYINQKKQIMDDIGNMTMDTKDEVMKQAKIFSTLTTPKMVSFLSGTLGEDGKKIGEANGIDELVSRYVIKNLRLLSVSEELKDGYEKLLVIVDDVLKRQLFSSELLMSLVLRSIKIMKELCVKNPRSVDGFLELGLSSNLLYHVYKGLYDGELSNPVYKLNNEKNKKLCKVLLNGEDVLPDSILVSLVTDKQFENYDSEFIVYLIETFFARPLTHEYDDVKEIAQTIFYNDLNDFTSKAEFLDLEDVYIKTRKWLDENSVIKMVGFISDIQNGDYELKRKNGKEVSHGNI